METDLERQVFANQRGRATGVSLPLGDRIVPGMNSPWHGFRAATNCQNAEASPASNEGLGHSTVIRHASMPRL